MTDPAGSVLRSNPAMDLRGWVIVVEKHKAGIQILDAIEVPPIQWSHKCGRIPTCRASCSIDHEGPESPPHGLLALAATLDQDVLLDHVEVLILGGGSIRIFVGSPRGPIETIAAHMDTRNGVGIPRKSLEMTTHAGSNDLQHAGRIQHLGWSVTISHADQAASSPSSQFIC